MWHEWPCPMAMEEIQAKKRDGQLSRMLKVAPWLFGIYFVCGGACGHILHMPLSCICIWKESRKLHGYFPHLFFVLRFGLVLSRQTARDHGFCLDSVNSIVFSWESKGTRTNATPPKKQGLIKGLRISYHCHKIIPTKAIFPWGFGPGGVFLNFHEFSTVEFS